MAFIIPYTTKTLKSYSLDQKAKEREDLSQARQQKNSKIEILVQDTFDPSSSSSEEEEEDNQISSKEIMRKRKKQRVK